MPKPLAAEGADTKFNSKNNQKQSQYSQVPIFNSVTNSLIFGFEVNPAFFFKLLTLIGKAVLNEMVSTNMYECANDLWKIKSELTGSSLPRMVGRYWI